MRQEMADTVSHQCPDCHPGRCPEDIERSNEKRRDVVILHSSPYAQIGTYSTGSTQLLYAQFQQ
jgi:hypothetical protein